jgi:hypothetical protein
MKLKKHIFILALCGISLAARSQQTTPAKEKAAYRAPAAFTENLGQVTDNEGKPHPEIKFTAALDGIRLFFRADGVSYVFSKDNDAGTDYYRTDLAFPGANSSARITGEEKQAGKMNYYLPQCPDGITNVSTYSSIVYHDLYPGIDLEYFIGEKGLKYQFIVHPGADASVIRLRYDAADNVALEAGKSITVSNPLGTISDAWPVSFTQEKHAEVKTDFVKKGNVLSFSNSGYDKTQTLVIDPFVRAWGTYFGSGTGEDSIKAMDYFASATFADAAIYVTGTTTSTTYIATAGAYSTTNHGNKDAFLSRFNKNGGLVWSTYAGGAGADIVNCLAANASGVAIGGFTTSTNYMASYMSFQNALSSTGACDAFIAKFTPTGARSWATYYGGPASPYYTGVGTDFITGIAIDNSNNIAVCGNTSSLNMATAGSFQTSYSVFTWGQYPPNGFVAKFNSTGGRTWGTYYEATTLKDVTFLSDGRVAVVGDAQYSAPVLNASQPVNAGQGDGILAVLQSGGNALSFATFIGGSSIDACVAVDEDQTHNIFITGYTQSSDGIASAGAYQSTFGGLVDGFVARYSSNGIKSWSTYYGGPHIDSPAAIATSVWGEVFIAGTVVTITQQTASSDALKPNFTYPDFSDGFIAKFTGTGAFSHSTFYGGKHPDPASTVLSERITGIATDANGSVVIAGYSNTQNANDPNDFSLGTSGTYMSANPNALNDYGTNGFVGMLADNEIKVVSLSPAAVCAGAPLTIGYSMLYLQYSYYTIYAELSDIYGSFSNPVSIGVITTSAISGTMNAVIPFNTPAGTAYKVRLKMVSPWGVVTIMGKPFTTNLIVKETPAMPVITTNSPVCVGKPLYLTTPPGLGATYAWTGPNAFAYSGQNPSFGSATAAQAGTYSLTLTLGGCTSAPGTATVVVNNAPPQYILGASGPTKFCNGLGVTLTCQHVAGQTYQWLNNGVPIAGETQNTLYVTASGYYSVVVTNAAGCSTESKGEEITVYGCGRLADPGVYAGAAGVYPNPSGGDLFIQLPEGETAAEVTIYNASGQLVLDEKLSGNVTQFDLHELSSGIYLVRVNAGGKVTTEKVVLNN